ncbi:MAG: DNA mismatch repair endonuclease MutL [Gemmatimonadales bacterium]|nr:MAG: DNA mismatch repair endonuclease MutL [Gemmatimonadales bacterium]
MRRTIQILPDSIANQIAAGEVVERPASVVKELVENALDAGATRVEISLQSGGKRLIRVSDDGAGMIREDALLALDRHATSKIVSADDLRTVPTFGFRGEALPSIASVSRLSLETRHGSEGVGTRVRVRGGTITGVEDLPRTPGTTVTVESLFFNAPARARFLRPPAVETRAVSELLTPLCLAHPAVRFSLESGSNPLLDLRGGTSLLQRVGELWGAELKETLLEVEGEEGGRQVRGLIQRPDAVRPGFRRAALFVAGRPFREAALLRAVDRGYRTTIPQGHRPWVVLFLDVPPGEVDVNVHPTKAEVRFRDRNGIEALVEEAVRRALEGEESAARWASGRGATSRGGTRAGAEHQASPAPASSSPTGEDAAAAGSGDGSAEVPGRGSGLLRDRPLEGAPGVSAPTRRGASEPADFQMGLFLSADPSAGAWDQTAGPDVREGTSGQEGDEGDGMDTLPSLARPRLWQIHKAWIMAEVRDGILLIDQHAAHERVLFEQIMARFQGEAGESQRLLFPLTVRLTRAEYEMVLDLAGLLNRAGFEVEGFGGDTVIVHAVPNPHPHFDAEGCFREMVDELTHGSELVRSARNQHERVAMSYACKAAIKAGQPLDLREMQELFDQLFATELPFHDVHGRPTTVRLTRTELERKFGR